MRLRCPDDPMVSIPFVVGSGPSESGPRLGGRAPRGVSPVQRDIKMEYFATIPFSVDPERELTIFVVSNFDDLFNDMGHLNELGLIEIVVHEPSYRGSDSNLKSRLSEHPLEFCDLREDWLIDEQGARITYSSHKLGGRPYLIHGNLVVEKAIAAAREKGFIHILQFDFPVGSDEATVSGDWPFADGLFHLFCRPPFQRSDWRWFWEF